MTPKSNQTKKGISISDILGRELVSVNIIDASVSKKAAFLDVEFQSKVYRIGFIDDQGNHRQFADSILEKHGYYDDRGNAWIKIPRKYLDRTKEEGVIWITRRDVW